MVDPNPQATATPRAPFNAPSRNPPIHTRVTDMPGSPTTVSMIGQANPTAGIAHHRTRGSNPPKKPSKIAVGITSAPGVVLLGRSYGAGAPRTTPQAGDQVGSATTAAAAVTAPMTPQMA
jgi:hypothetical protein